MVAASAAVWIAFSASAAAETFRPTRFDDPAAAKCKASNCSLRGAISAANDKKGKDRVLLKGGTYELTQAETAVNDNSGGDLDVKGEVVIRGKGPTGTTVDANGASRVFSLLKDAPKSIERLAVTGGSADVGAGILVASAQADFETRKHSLKRLLILQNTATASGGGVSTGSHPVKISKTRIVGNFAGSGGGGVFMGSAPTAALDDPLSISATTVNSNQAGLGAGIYLDGFNPSAEFPYDPRADIVNSTFALNVAAVSGGGLAAIQGAQLDAEHTTVAYNTADGDGVGGGNGGGIYQSSDASFAIENSLVKENTVGPSGDGPQCAGDFRFIGVITPQGTPGLCEFTPGSIIQGEVEPRISPLTDNGGPTPTIEIQADSLANGWNEGLCPVKDQRGEGRPTSGCDVGAFERP
jgi:hypothetical protein